MVMENFGYISLSQALKARTDGLFLNDKGEYCRVNSCYYNNKRRIEVIFSKNICDVSTRPALISTSEKRVLKFLNSEKFVSVN